MINWWFYTRSSTSNIANTLQMCLLREVRCLRLQLSAELTCTTMVTFAQSKALVCAGAWTVGFTIQCPISCCDLSVQLSYWQENAIIHWRGHARHKNFESSRVTDCKLLYMLFMMQLRGHAKNSICLIIITCLEQRGNVLRPERCFGSSSYRRHCIVSANKIVCNLLEQSSNVKGNKFRKIKSSCNSRYE